MDTPTLGDNLFESGDYFRVVPGPGKAVQLTNRFLWRLDRWSKDPGLGDGIEGVARVDDSRADRYLFTLDSVGITCPIPPLMVMMQDLRDLSLLWMLGEDLGALNRMGLDDFVFFRG